MPSGKKNAKKKKAGAGPEKPAPAALDAGDGVDAGDSTPRAESASSGDAREQARHAAVNGEQHEQHDAVPIGCEESGAGASAAAEAAAKSAAALAGGLTAAQGQQAGDSAAGESRPDSAGEAAVNGCKEAGEPLGGGGGGGSSRATSQLDQPVALADGDSELPAAALEIAAVEELAADAETDGVRAADAPPAELSAATEVEPRAETPEAAELSAEMFSADERARLEQQALALQAAEQEFAQEIAADATVQHETGTALASQAAGMSEEERAIVEKRMLAILGFRRETEGASVLHDAEQECAQALAALRLQAPCNAKAEDLEEAAAGTTAPEPCLSQPGVGAEPEAELEIVPAEAAEPKEMTDEERAIVEQVARALQAAELSAAAEEVEPGTETPEAAKMSAEMFSAEERAMLEQQALALQAAEQEFAQEIAADATRSQVEADGATPAGAAASEAGPEHDLAVEPAATVQPETGTAMAPQAAEMSAPPEAGAGVEQDLAAEDTELEIVPAEAAEPTTMTDEEKAIVEQMTRLLQASEAELAEEGLAFGAAGAQAAAALEPRGAEEPQGAESVERKLPPVHPTPQKPLAKPSPSPSPQLATPSSGWSWFGSRKAEEPKAEEPQDAPDISSEMCANILRDIDAILQDGTRKKASLVKVLQEARDKVREVDEKAQGASNEAKLLSCAAVLKAGVQTAELKHKTLSVKGLELLRRLASYKAMQAMYFPAVAKALRACATCGEVAIQLKVLQVCAAVAETDQMIAAIGPALSIMEAILLVMGASMSGASMAAEATLHQAVMASLTYVEACDHRYERVLETGSPAGNLDKAHGLLEQGVDVLAQVLNELMVLCSSKASERLKYSKPERGNVVALFVMQDVVRSRAAVLTKFAPLRSVFVNSVCPILLKQLQRIGAGTLRLLPREEPRQYSKRVALAVSYLNTVSALVSSLPQAEDPHKSADPALLTAITNLLAVLVTMAQEANPSWVRLAALEVLQDFCTAPALAYRARHIFMFCRSFDELQLEGSTSSPSTNILVSLIQTLEALVVKLLDEPGADAGAAAAKVLTSEKLGLHKKNAPLVTLTRSLIVAPREGDEGRWVRGLEALKFGDLSSLGGGQDGVLTPQEISKNKTARAVLVECVRAEMALMCSMRLMQSMASMCGVVNWRHRASKEDAVSIAQTANKDDEQIAANAEACWHLMRACAPSFIKVSQVALKAVDAQPLVRAMASATSSLAQAATVLQMVQIRDLCFNCLCAFAEAGMAEIPGLDFTRSLSELPSAEVAKQRGMLEMYAPAVWDWRRSLLTQELLGLLLEAAAEMYEAWSIVLPVLQRLHFELAARVRVERATGDERPELSAPGSPSDPVANVEPVSAQSSGADAGAAAAPLASISGDGEADGMRGISASSLLASLDALFSTTTVLADGALVELIEGLARLAPIMPSTLAPSPADAETEDGDTLGAPPPPAAVPVSTVGDGRWGMQQTLLVARQNFFRLHVIWEAVLKMAHLASYPRGWIRDFGAKSMVQLAHDALIFLSGPESLSDEAAAASRSARDGQADKATECRVMASYEVMYASPYSDVRHTVLAGLQGLLQSCASKQVTLTSGWRPLLGLLASVPHGKTEPSLMREAVACLEVICQSLLSHLAPEDVEALAKSLKAMASQEADQPSALGAIVLLRQLASFLTANRDTLVARLLPPADQLAHPRGQDHARAEKETEVLRAVEGKANLILDMIIQDVLSSLFSLVLDWRVKVREDAMKGVFTLLTEDDYLAEPARLTQICRRQMMPLLDAVAKQVESCEEDGSLCWQQWLATWLSLVQGVPVLLENSLPALPSDADSARQQAREGGSGDGGPEKARGDGKGEGGVRGSGGEREMEWLGAWEGLLDRLTLAWVCGNLFVLRAAIQGIMVPLGRSAALMPRAGWDLVWDKMPVLLVAALRTSAARDSGQVPNSRRVLPGHVMASVVVEELLQVCAQPDVRRDAGCLAGQLSLVSARNMRTLIQLVGAATIDFRSSSPDSPVSMSADARQPPETRREHATRLYTALARAASDRSNLQEALDLWSQIIWSLLRHLPCVTREEMKMRQDQKWCAGLVFPDYLQALAAGFACPDLAADVLAKLLYEELQEHEAVLRGVWETTTVAMLVAMCSRHRGALFRHWAPVASAFAVVLLVSVKVLGSPGDAAAAKSPQLNGQEHEGGAQELVDEEAKMVDDDEARRIGLVQRLTGGMQAFLVPPADPATKSEEGLPDEEQQVARVEAQVVLALVRHVIPCARGAQIREDLMYMLDSLVGAACSPGAQGRRNSLACNCLEGLLSLADARGMQPLPQTPAPASAPSSPAAPAGNSVTGAPSTASDVPSTCTSSSSTQPSCVSPWADTQVATVNMAAKIAIERCRAILVAYLAMETVLNERLLALPGVRGTRSFKSHDDRTAGGSLRVSAEVALKAMEGLERLRLHPSTFRFLVHALEDRVAIPSPAAGGEEEEVEDEEEEGEAALWLPSMCKEQCLRLVSEGLEEEHAARVMSRGHLLLLFSTIVDTVASENRVLRQMAQSMLRTVALDIRLVTIC